MFWATACSDVADGIGRTAVPLAAASYTRDPLAIAGLASFAFLPWLFFALPSGVLVDRVDRRYAMAGANAVRAAALTALAVLALTHQGSIVLLYVVAFALMGLHRRDLRQSGVQVRRWVSTRFGQTCEVYA
jgi:MFS family permease